METNLLGRLRHSAGWRARGGMLAAIASAGALSLTAACGAGGASSASGATTSEAQIKAATANSERYAAEPSQVPGVVKLKQPPPKKTVAFIVCADPSCTDLAKYVKQATDSLGWTLRTISASASDPQGAFQQAIDAKVDYIAETGYDLNMIPNAVSEAKKAGIPLFGAYLSDIPAGESNGLYSNVQGSDDQKLYADSLIDWIVSDSKGKANVLDMGLPAFPILDFLSKEAKSYLEKTCPGCTVQTLDMTFDDLSNGAVPTKMVNYLKTHPDINYIYETYEGFDHTGIVSALKSAGLSDKVKVVGMQGFQLQMKQMVAGDNAAWTSIPYSEGMWELVDQMARYSVNQWSAASANAIKTPFMLVDTKAQAESLLNEPYGWPGVKGFEDTYKSAWGVG